jgi:hypothetical protein
VRVNMEHGWLVSDAQLIDPTLVLSLTFDLAVFFSPVHCLTKNLPRRLAQLAIRNSWRDSLLTKLAGAIVHG